MDDNTKDTTPNGWTKAYHPTGLQVTLPVPTNSVITIDAAKLMLVNVSNYIGAGWLVNPPGLEDGEKEDFITRVVKRTKANDDGTETPVIDIYPGRANFRILGIYLNTPADVQAFEKAADVKLADLPLYEGDNSIECGKSLKTDKYVITRPHPFKVIYKANPAYEGDEDKKHPKRLFVRWGVTDIGAPEAPDTKPPVADDSKKHDSTPTPTTSELRAKYFKLVAQAAGLAIKAAAIPENATDEQIIAAGKKLAAQIKSAQQF